MRRRTKESKHIYPMQKAVMSGLTEPDVVQAIKKSQHYPEVKDMLSGNNIFEGIVAFNQKRKPQWSSSL